MNVTHTRRPWFARHTVAVATIVAVCLTAGACSGGDGASSSTQVPDDATQVVAGDTTTSTIAVPSTTIGAATGEASSTSDPVPQIVTDGVTVTDETIYVGVLADLSGPFSGNVIDVVDAQLAFWADLNAQGGIAGRSIEVLVTDTQYNPVIHQQLYANLVDDVVMFAHSTGSPHTAAIADDLVRDDRLAVPVGWYSGWSDPVLGANLLELGSNYCLEAANVVSHLAETHESQFSDTPTLAIVTDAGDYGQDSAIGAKRAAEALGVEVVLDGEGELRFGDDNTQIATAIATSGADYTWLATDPLTTADVVSKALIAGYRGAWSGASPSFSPRLLDTALGDYLASTWLVSVFFSPLGADVEGMDEVYAVLQDAFPDRYPSDAFVAGYLEFSVAAQVLGRAAALGDLTPRGVEAAAADLGTVRFGGIGPENTFTGRLDEAAARATALYRPGKTVFDEQGGLTARLADGAVSPFELVADLSVSDVAAEMQLDGPCYVFGA